MKKYRITSVHDVFVDSFKDGELNEVNSYFLEHFIDANNFIDAIKKYFKDFLCYDFDLKYCGKDNVDLFYNVLVDSENIQATENEKILWKNGKMILYSNNITLQCFELKKINFTSNNKFFNN